MVLIQPSSVNLLSFNTSYKDMPFQKKKQTNKTSVYLSSDQISLLPLEQHMMHVYAL